MKIRLVETDAGGNIKLSVTLNIDSLGTLATTIDEGSNDDEVGQITWFRPTYIAQQYNKEYISAAYMRNKIKSFIHTETVGGSGGITLRSHITILKRPY